MESETIEEPILASSTIDDIIESCMSSTGFFQIFQAVLISIAWGFDVQQSFINVFTDMSPAWHCTEPEDSSCTSAVTPCKLPDHSWSWNLSKHTSIISEWDLQCSSPLITGMPASAYFLGCFTGGIFLATISDSWLGRKSMLFFSCLTMSLATFLTAFSSNIWMYSSLRFITGVGRANVPTTALVLASEIVGKRMKDRVSTLGFLFIPPGFVALPIMAYLNRGNSWRYLYIWTSAPFLCYTFSLYFFVSESPRWLLVRGRRDEAIKTLKRISKCSSHVIDTSFANRDFAEEKWNASFYSALKILWVKKWAFRRLSGVMTVGFGVGMVYYGLPLNLGNLGSNLYLSVAYAALCEIPSSLLAYICVAKMNRRLSMLILSTVSGISSILCMFLRADQGWQLAVDMVSYIAVAGAFCVLLVYSVELFPTCIRNSAASMVRQAVMLAAVLAPIIVAEGRKESSLSFGMFGIVIGFCGLFVLRLPETRGIRISDTIEEEEYKQNAKSNVNA